MPEPAVVTHAPVPEAELLQDAIGPVEASLISREPLGDGTVAGFEVAEGSGAQTYFVDTSRLAVAEETGIVAEDGGARPSARIWLHPADPHLPALAASAFGASLGVLLGRLGISVAGDAEMVAYRPGRRGVIRVPTQTSAVWIKVVRPRRLQRIVDAHRACAEAGLPVPDLLGWADDGLIVLGTARGVPAADADWTPDRLLAATDDLRARVARVPTDARVKPIGARLPWYASRLRQDADATRLVRQIGERLEQLDPMPTTTVHGDLHFGQLFLTGQAITGVIDVDTVGVGAPAEDAAAFISHAIASARLTESGRAITVWTLAESALARWDSDPGVRPATAVHLLGHSIAATDIGDDISAAAFAADAARILAGGAADPGD